MCLGQYCTVLHCEYFKTWHEGALHHGSVHGGPCRETTMDRQRQTCRVRLSAALERRGPRRGWIRGALVAALWSCALGGALRSTRLPVYSISSPLDFAGRPSGSPIACTLASADLSVVRPNGGARLQDVAAGCFPPDGGKAARLLHGARHASRGASVCGSGPLQLLSSFAGGAQSSWWGFSARRTPATRPCASGT